MAKHQCKSCAETFDTLAAKRLHERDECDQADWRAALGDDPAEVDAQVEQAVKKALVCDVCELHNDGAESIDREVTDGDVRVTINFRCEHCTATNENTIIMY